MTQAGHLGLTVYGCGPTEAALFRELAARHDVLPTITEAPVSEATVELARGHRCISVGHKDHITRSMLTALSRVGVRYVSTRSIGCNHIDVDDARAVGIAVETVTYSPDSVADHTLMLMLMAVREAKSMLRRTEAHDYRLGTAPAKELRDLTVGVVGTGLIGEAVLARLRGFGCRTLAHDSRPRLAAEYVTLDELVRRSDVVTLHTPLTDATHHLLDRRRIEQLKDGAFVVNTGRGALVDTEALLRALESGRLGGAALDVVEGEDGTFYADCRDRPIDSTFLRLQHLPRVLMSPHTAYYTDHALRDAVEHSIANCVRFENEGAPWPGQGSASSSGAAARSTPSR
jgi:D-specific alpha-keto acid dehydrogenase